MRRRIKKIIKILVTLLISVVVIASVVFYFCPSLFVDFYVSNDGESIWVMTSPITFSWKILDTSSENNHLSWSPDEKYLAYTDFVREVMYNKEYFIKIIDPRTMKSKTIFIGPWITSNYEWIDNNTIRIYIGGASGARFYRNLDIHRKKPYVYVDDRRADDDSKWGIEVYKSDGSTVQINGDGSIIQVKGE
jgi:hypothetical protein